MKLSEFIEDTLTEIVKGVESAQKNVSDTNAEIAPSGLVKFSNDQLPYLYKSGRGIVNIVEYDVAVETSGEDSTKAGIGIVMAAIGAGAQAATSDKSSNIHRIKFTVPLLLPGKDANEEK
jgi:alpha-D-ribose 1-methylphosphonate 5-triphosphate diphosphatase PhnM